VQRRSVLGGLAAAWIAAGRLGWAASANGQHVAEAARAQVGVTTGYDPTWTKLSYPGGDVPRSTGVCADVVIRAARDGLGLDLQKLVHEDMVKDFDAYPARKAWEAKKPDWNIDHRRVLNLEAYWTRAGARLWAADVPMGRRLAMHSPNLLRWATFSPGCSMPGCRMWASRSAEAGKRGWCTTSAAEWRRVRSMRFLRNGRWGITAGRGVRKDAWFPTLSPEER
jgi:uncharacterized protein YijF (DUF1287 family)